MEPSSARAKRSMAKLDRGRGRYRSRYRRDAWWDSAVQNRVPQPYYCGADTTLGSEVWAFHEGQERTRTGIDSDPDSDPDWDNDRTDRQPLVHLHVLAASSCTCTASLCTCTFLGRA